MARSQIEVVIRHARFDERESIGFFLDCILRRDYYMKRSPLDEVLSGIRHETFVALEGSWIVGLAILTRGDRLVNILVHPSYRGIGLGRAMLELSGAKSVRVKLDMAAGSPLGFYVKQGFQVCREQTGKDHVVVVVRVESG